VDDGTGHVTRAGRREAGAAPYWDQAPARRLASEDEKGSGSSVPTPDTPGAEPPRRHEGNAAADRPGEPARPGARHRPVEQAGLDSAKDIVEVTGEGSFPGSDPPSWSQAVAR